MRGWGKKDYEGVADNEGMQREETKRKARCRPTPVTQEHGSCSKAAPTPRAEEKGNTFALLSGCGVPSSLPSVLRGRGSLDSPGDIITARPIDANRKQEKEFRIIHVIRQAELPLTQVLE